ncbi:hypothetical protein SAMN04487995_0685 [Dyadobacter koreensis]|uniref:Uncharacterized protein n=2 Tax=Dyadobacter koreensis TaxID=408657 RepID=A0A1H6QMV3_9BACT|nr:hypothetical protein SAMN04487995_0685 [Dyadobacter koreensis]
MHKLNCMNDNVLKRRRIAGFLLVLWWLICLSNVVFRHAHRMPDGRIVSHVHPYAEFGSKCNFPNHHHTQSELNWLDCVSNIPFDSFVPELSFSVPALWLELQLTYPYNEQKSEANRLTLFLRGPPFFVV